MRLISPGYENMPKKVLTSRKICGILCRHRKHGCEKEKSTFTTEHNSFNFAEDFSKRRNREPIHQQRKRQEERTSYTEDRVDALALWTEEGRGDRRNVPGELHASVDPGESEWGNPSRVMSGDPHLNP